jgi:hypothetical protein
MSRQSTGSRSALRKYGPAVGIAGAAISIALLVTTVALTLVSNKVGEVLSGGDAEYLSTPAPLASWVACWWLGGLTTRWAG